MTNNIWSEIHDDYQEDDILYFDGYCTDDDNEQGRVIAKLNVHTLEVEYLDERARTNSFAQEVIGEAIKSYKQVVVDAVIEELKKSFEEGDNTVLEELLFMIPKVNLIGALPEEQWSKFQ